MELNFNLLPGWAHYHGIYLLVAIILPIIVLIIAVAKRNVAAICISLALIILLVWLTPDAHEYHESWTRPLTAQILLFVSIVYSVNFLFETISDKIRKRKSK